MNAIASVSAGEDVAGFGRDASESEGNNAGVPNDGDTSCVGLNAVSSAEDAEAYTGSGWAVNVNGLDAEVPAPKPTNPPNLG